MCGFGAQYVPHSGVQLGTIDALLAQLAIVNKHTLLTADRDFVHAAPIGLRCGSPDETRVPSEFA